jgi:hypothetical protein
MTEGRKGRRRKERSVVRLKHLEMKNRGARKGQKKRKRTMPMFIYTYTDSDERNNFKLS